MAAIEWTLERLTPHTGWSAASSLILKSFCSRTLRSLTAAISVELLARREKIDETLHSSKCERSIRCAVRVAAGCYSSQRSGIPWMPPHSPLKRWWSDGVADSRKYIRLCQPANDPLQERSILCQPS